MIEKILSFLLGGGGTLGAITNTAKVLGVAALAPIGWKFIEGHGQEVLFTVNVNQALAAGGVGLLLVLIAHAARGQ